MRVAVIIPAYNAANKLPAVIKKIPKVIKKKDIVVVDDGSSDDTYEIAKKLNVTILRHKKNRGYGGAQKTAYNYAKRKGYEITIMIHADGQHDPKQIPDFIGVIKNGYDAVTGTRFKSENVVNQGMPLKRFIGNRILTFLIKFVSGLEVSETHNGYRAYSLKTLKSINFNNNSNKFEFDTEILFQIKSKHLKIGEVPIKTVYRDEKSHLNIWTYGSRMLSVILRYVLLRKYR